MAEQTKYKLSELETENLTKIKREDIETMIRLVNHVTTQIHYGTKMQFPSSDFNVKMNPITGYSNLLDSIEYALDHYNIGGKEYSRPGWELPEGDMSMDERNKANDDLRKMLWDARMALVNSVQAVALDDERYSKEYQRSRLAHDQNVVQLGNITNAQEKDEQLKRIKDGFVVPKFDKNTYKFYYTNGFKNKDGKYIDITDAEFSDWTYYTHFDIEKEKKRLENDVLDEYRRKENVRNEMDSYYGGLSGIDTAIRNFGNER